MEFFNFQDHFFVAIMTFNRPASEIEPGDFIFGEHAIVEIRQKHGQIAIRTDEFDDSQLDDVAPLFLFGRQCLQKLIGWGQKDVAFIPVALNERLHCRERGFGRAAKDKVPFIMFPDICDEAITGITTVEERHVPFGDEGQQALSFLPLRTMDADDTPRYGKMPEDIICGGDKTLRVMPFPFVLQSAFGIEFSPDLRGCRQRELGTIDGEHRHPMPQVGGVVWPEPVRQFDSFAEDVSKNGPEELLSCARKPTAVNRFRLMPKTATPCGSEKLPRFGVHSLASSTGSDGKNENDESRKGKFSISGKIHVRLPIRGVDILGNNVEKMPDAIARLA